MMAASHIPGWVSWRVPHGVTVRGHYVTTATCCQKLVIGFTTCKLISDECKSNLCETTLKSQVIKVIELCVDLLYGCEVSGHS